MIDPSTAAQMAAAKINKWNKLAGRY